jgi:hypothetical protein
MSYPIYTRQMLADFTGRPAASFPEPYVTSSAFPQATLLFKIGTCIADPAGLSTDEQQMVDFAIMSMADAIHLAQPYQTILASPFSSESIGSYSYGKAVKAVQQGLPTGITWFDIAVEQLSQCSELDGIPMTGGIEVFERTGGYFGPGHLGGNIQFLSPADVEASRQFGFDPASGNYVSQVSS